MKLNVGPIESFVRIFAGICLAYSALYGYVGNWGYLGLVLVVTGLARFCPVTAALRINTNKVESWEEK